MMQTNEGNSSFKDLIFKAKRLVAYLFSKWLILLVAGLLGGASGVLYATFTRITYSGELSFVLSGGSSSGGLSSLAGQFGIDLSGGSGDDAFQGDNIIKLLTSQRIVRKALYQPLPDKSDVLINVLARENGLAKKWGAKEGLKNEFPFPINEAKRTPIQDSLFRVMYRVILKKHLTVEKIDKKLNFYAVTTESTNAKFSSMFTHSLVSEAIKFYIETKTKTANENLRMLQREADSLRGLLGGAVNSAAFAADRTFNLNPAALINRTSVQKSQMQIEVLGTAYGEVVKNLELAKISLQKETPIVQVIDEPVLPLDANRKSKTMGLIFGGFLGGFLAIFVLILRRAYVNILKEDI